MLANGMMICETSEHNIHLYIASLAYYIMYYVHKAGPLQASTAAATRLGARGETRTCKSTYT
jgi:hypothetical protein